MFAEYEKAQIMERYRRGKAHRAKTGSSTCCPAPRSATGTSARPRTPAPPTRSSSTKPRWSAELFRRYADDGASIADLARWLTDQGVPTRTGKHRWDRSVIWAMLRNPAYAGHAVFGKTMAVQRARRAEPRRPAAGPVHPAGIKTVDRPREEWTAHPGPGHRQPSRPSTGSHSGWPTTSGSPPATPRSRPCCRAWPPARAADTATTATSTRTTSKKIYYYRCLGSDDYRYEGGRVCANKPVRADYLDQVVWDHITALLADPALIRAEIDKRLDAARTADPAIARTPTPRRPRWPRPPPRSPG